MYSAWNRAELGDTPPDQVQILDSLRSLGMTVRFPRWDDMLLRHLITPALLGGLAVAQSSPASADEPSVMRPRAGVDTVRTSADTVREYRGVYEAGFEVSWFHPCDATPGDDTWWVTLTNDALHQRDSLARTLTGRPRAVLVRWRATVGPKMPMGAGHMGRGSRYTLVTQVLSLSAADSAGCTTA